jgi:hypothetical protein
LSSSEIEARGASSLRGWLPEILFVAITTAAGVVARGRWLSPIGDTGIWWSLLHRIFSGQRLYREIYLQYGPLSPYLLALGARVFGLSAIYLILSGWVAAIACGLLLLRLARRLLAPLERLAVAGLLLPLSVFGPGISPLVLAYAPASVHALAFSLGALLMLDNPGERGRVRSQLAGLAAGLALCAKPEIGVAALLSLCGYLFFVRAPWSRLFWVLAGFGVATAMGLAFVVWSAPDPTAWRRSHLWPLALGVPEPWRNLFRILMGVSDPDWVLFVRASTWTVMAVLVPIVAAGLLLARERVGRGWLPVAALALVVAAWWLGEGYLLTNRFWPACLSMLVSLSVGVWSVADRRLPLQRRALLFAVSSFAVFNGARSAFSTDLLGPYAKVSQFNASLTWVLFACLLVPSILTASEKSRKTVRTLVAVLLVIVSWREAFLSASHLSPPSVVPFATGSGTVWVVPSMARFLTAVQKEVRPAETAAILPEINAVDVLFGLRDQSPWLTHVPGWLDDEAESVLIHAFEQRPPDVVVLFNRPTWLFRKAPFGRGYGLRLSRWIADRYRAVCILPEGTILRPRTWSEPISESTPYN